MKKYKPNAKPGTYLERAFMNFRYDLLKKPKDKVIPESLDSLIADFLEGRSQTNPDPCDDDALIANTDLIIHIKKVYPKLELTSQTMMRAIAHDNVQETSKKVCLSRHLLRQHLKQLDEELQNYGIHPQTRKRKKN